jgi:UDP-glucose 4-epimerase
MCLPDHPHPERETSTVSRARCPTQCVTRRSDNFRHRGERAITDPSTSEKTIMLEIVACVDTERTEHDSPGPMAQRQSRTSTRPPASTDARSSAAPSVPPPALEGSVLVTGIVGRLGKHLCRVLHREVPVIGIDRREFADRPKDVIHHQLDIRRRKMRDIFRGGNIRAVVHLGVMHDPRASASEHHTWNVVAFAKMLEYMAQYRVPKLVVLSSANVYGPQADNPQFLVEESPLLGGQEFSEIRDLIEVDMLAQSFFWRHPETETVILRPVHILGNVRNAPSNYLRLAVVPTLMGFDPMVQVIHQDDVVNAIQCALASGIRGIFNVAGPEPLPLSRILKMLGRATVPVPHTLGKGVLKNLWRYRLSSFPAPELDHIRYVCMVDDNRARAQMGYSPRHALRETVSAVDDA